MERVRMQVLTFYPTVKPIILRVDHPEPKSLLTGKTEQSFCFFLSNALLTCYITKLLTLT